MVSNRLLSQIFFVAASVLTVIVLIEALLNFDKILGRPVARSVGCPPGSTRCQLVSAETEVPQDLT